MDPGSQMISDNSVPHYRRTSARQRMCSHYIDLTNQVASSETRKNVDGIHNLTRESAFV